MLCTVAGPAEMKGGVGRREEGREGAGVDVRMSVAGFAGTGTGGERKRGGRGDRCVLFVFLFVFVCMSMSTVNLALVVELIAIPSHPIPSHQFSMCAINEGKKNEY